MKNLKQALELMTSKYGTDPDYIRFNYTSVEVAPSLRPRQKYCDVTGLPVNHPNSMINGYTNCELMM